MRLQHSHEEIIKEHKSTESLWKVERDQLIEQLPQVCSQIPTKHRKIFNK